MDTLVGADANVATATPAMRSGNSVATRKQWSSCDFCRKRKKRCDAASTRESSETAKCSRCLEYGVACTFEFVSQKSTLQVARKRQSLAVKKNREAAIPFDDQHYGFDDSDTLEILHYPVENAPVDVNLFREVSSKTVGLSEAEIHDILFESPSTAELDFPNTPPDLVEEINRITPELTSESSWTAFPMDEAKLTHLGTHSGLSPELEEEMLRDFADLGYKQMPVVDMDLVFVRYRFGLPTPLPRYLTMALVACGASYSCQKPEPGIDRERAKFIFELARLELVAAAQTELCLDIISALIIVSFHWQGDLTRKERVNLLDFSVRKIQQMGLHQEHNLVRNRNVREAGLLRYIVWLNYIVDAFAGTLEDFMLGTRDNSRLPYNGQEIELAVTSAEDMSFMYTNYLTGAIRPNMHPGRLQLALRFNQSFGKLAKLQNQAVNLQRLGYSIEHLVPELKRWEERYLPGLDMSSEAWEDSGPMAEMLPAVTSLNFSYWYCALNIYFDKLKTELDTDNYRIRPGQTPPASTGLDEDHVLGCFQAFTSLITLFEKLSAGQRLFQTAQSVRGHLYYGGRILQIFYRNHVKYKGIPIVDSLVLQRWETCLAICEVVWGYSSRSFDLSQMSLQDVS